MRLGSLSLRDDRLTALRGFAITLSPRCAQWQAPPGAAKAPAACGGTA